MPVAFWVVYGIIALVVGYFVGRDVYRNGTRDGARPSSTTAALVFMVLFGSCWPLLVGSFLLYCAVTTRAWKRLGEALFGEPV